MFEYIFLPFCNKSLWTSEFLGTETRRCFRVLSLSIPEISGVVRILSVIRLVEAQFAGIHTVQDLFLYNNCNLEFGDKAQPLLTLP